ncbi:MAG: exonuclease SbcCD subunit D [Chloroflexia bacterium]|nr:exonuclease SbcCD subunit D [Chloroflexia bacterium]
MRILHFADLHLGIETYGSFDTQTGLSTRILDFLHAFDRIVDYAIEHQVDAVLFAGDAFKNRDPSPTLQREFARRIVRLSEAKIPIVLLVGNHDLPASTNRATHTEIYSVLEIPGVYVCREIDLIDVCTRAGSLQVVTVPWVTRSMFLASEHFRVMAQDNLEKAMADTVSKLVGELLPEITPDSPAVLLAHLSVQGATFGFERSIMLGKDLTVGLDDMSASAFDYVALGHIHKHQQIIAQPPAVYAGSPERVDFGEEREAKGFVDLTISAGERGQRTTEWKFVELETRPFRTVRIDATGGMPMVVVEREIRAQSDLLKDAIVRCYVEVDQGLETSVSSLEIRRMIAATGASHIARVVVESETVNRQRLELQAGDEFDSIRMLEKWIEQKQYQSQFGERLLEKGRELIERQRRESERGQG